MRASVDGRQTAGCHDCDGAAAGGVDDAVVTATDATCCASVWQKWAANCDRQAGHRWRFPHWLKGGRRAR